MVAQRNNYVTTSDPLKMLNRSHILFCCEQTWLDCSQRGNGALRGHSYHYPTVRREAEKLPLSGFKGHTGGMVLCSGLVIVLIVC